MIMRGDNEEKFIVENLKGARYTPLSRQDEIRLFQECRAGIAGAHRKLLDANLRFVAAVARRYKHHGLAFGELFNEGYLGLTTAVERFDHSRGLKFISYAVWWVRQRMLLALAQQTGPLKRPPTILQWSMEIERAFKKISQAEGREPTPEEMAAEAGISVKKLVSLKNMLGEVASLDAPLYSDNDATAKDMIQDLQADAGGAAANGMDYRFLTRLMEGLTEIEKDILARYHGLQGEPSMTLDEIGALKGLTRERIRQIKGKALQKARVHARTVIREERHPAAQFRPSLRVTQKKCYPLL